MTRPVQIISHVGSIFALLSDDSIVFLSVGKAWERLPPIPDSVKYCDREAIKKEGEESLDRCKKPIGHTGAHISVNGKLFFSATPAKNDTTTLAALISQLAAALDLIIEWKFDDTTSSDHSKLGEAQRSLGKTLVILRGLDEEWCKTSSDSNG